MLRFFIDTRSNSKRSSSYQALGDLQRLDRPKITSRLDQRINGVPKFQVEQDATGREIIANPIPQVLDSLQAERR